MLQSLGVHSLHLLHHRRTVLEIGLRIALEVGHHNVLEIGRHIVQEADLRTDQEEAHNPEVVRTLAEVEGGRSRTVGEEELHCKKGQVGANVSHRARRYEPTSRVFQSTLAHWELSCY